MGWVDYLTLTHYIYAMDIEKKCPDCSVTKSCDEYSKDKSKKTGLATYCKACSSVRAKGYYKDNSSVIKGRSSARYRADPVRHYEIGAKWKSNNRDKHLEYRKRYHRSKSDSDISYVMNSSIRAMVRRVLNAANMPKDFVTFEKIGYTCDMLMSRMEVQFSCGMCWENYGEWEIDHKIPVSIMISRGELRPDKINMLSNLQPLWKRDNRVKGARYVG